MLRGCLVGLLGVAVGFAVVGDVADVGARHLATSKVEQRVRQVVPHTTGVHGRIESFPFLRVGLNGHIDEIGVRVDKLTSARVVYSHIVVDLKGARVSIGNMVTLRVNVTEITQGTVSFTLASSDLAAAAPSVAASGAPPTTAAVDGPLRLLVLDPSSAHPVVLPLPPASLVPCVPGVAPGPAGLTFGCSFTTVPTAFRTS